MPAADSILELTPLVQISSAPAQEVQDFFDSLGNLDPIKYRPPSANLIARYPVMSNTHISYGSIINSNPYSSDRYTRLSDFIEESPPALKMVYNSSGRPEMSSDDSRYQPTYRHQGMSHSLSEGNIEFRSRAKATQAYQPNHTVLGSSLHGHCVNGEILPVSSSTPPRGRSDALRNPSPFKLDDIKEHESSPDERPVTPVKRSRSPVKQIFNGNSWLSKSRSMKDMPTESKPKVNNDTESDIRGLGSRLKKGFEHLAGDLTRVDISRFIPNTPPKSPPRMTRFYVSISPPFQAKLYSELELMICATANSYLAIQQREGRMSVESLSKVLTAWANKGRPQVLEFMFDQSTQRDLVQYNLKTFRFYGPHAENIISMNSMMQSWKGLAREMAVRTFCAPDSAIKKNFHDTEKVLVMLGAPPVTLLAFHEIKEKAEKMIVDGTRGRKLFEKLGYGTENQVDLSGMRTPVEGNPFA